MRGYKNNFTAEDYQDIKVEFTVKYDNEFMDQSDRDEYIDTFAEQLIDTLNDQVDAYEIVETNFDDTLIKSEIYYIIVRVTISVAGTFTFYPGRDYGPPEDCYPDEIDDYEYTDGVITSCDVDLLERKLAEWFTYVNITNVTIGDPTYDTDYNVLEEPEYEEEYDPDDFRYRDDDDLY